VGIGTGWEWYWWEVYTTHIVWVFTMELNFPCR